MRAAQRVRQSSILWTLVSYKNIQNYRLQEPDEKENKHFIKDYQLYTRSLVLSLVKDGEEIKSENLQKIWQYARNRQQFREYVVREIEAIREGAL